MTVSVRAAMTVSPVPPAACIADATRALALAPTAGLPFGLSVDDAARIAAAPSTAHPSLCGKRGGLTHILPPDDTR